MEGAAVAEGLWGLADHHEKLGDIGKTIKCLEAICQSQISFLPLVEVKTRLRVSALLLRYSHNVNHAKSHLERSLLLLKSIPSSFDLKFRTFSLLSHCYHLLASFPPQRNLLLKALELASSVPQDLSAYLWSCNFNSQLANTFIIQADFPSSLSALESGFLSASHICFPELQWPAGFRVRIGAEAPSRPLSRPRLMFFTASMLHVHIMQWTDDYSVEKAVQRCDDIWQTVSSDKTERCPGLFFYNEMLHVFYRLRLCDYKNAQHHVDRLDQAMNAHSHKTQEVQQLQDELSSLSHSLSRNDLPYRERAALSDRQSQLQDRVNALSQSSTTTANSLEPAFFGNMDRAWTERLLLSQSPIDGEWLPKSAIYALVHLMVVISGRPKGLFKECSKRIDSGMLIIQDELIKLGITDEVREADLRHTAIWMSGIYLMLQMQFLENKVALELTRSEYVDAQEALVEMKNLFTRFPTILQASECVIEMLRGQYSHSVGCYGEAAFHSIQASKLTESKSLQATCQAFAAVSYLTIGDADSSSKALDLIGPLYGITNSLSGVREEASILFAYGLLLMKQQDLQEARNRLAKGLQIAHTHMSNLQLVSQYLTLLGNLALSLHDTVQAREILRSSLTLAKKLSDIPTQLWVLSSFTALYQQLGEKGSEMENEEHRKKKWDEMQSRLAEARGSIHHIELVEKARLEMDRVEDAQEQCEVTYGMQASLDIPESVGIEGPSPAQYSSRLVGLDTGKRWGKRRV
ncbi:sister chromatid cohesion protein SCC4 isoform X1 [Raphanus sativus]|uniref:Sister chromatid cohesion protein SCC4 isoform X1 n=1 Tax=Raphanus sativus TaxID=3726 RepID=A0A9W3CG72_RAPSA|nr:sister chromatid cohesion protein SCC4 isoform X1 [Raphanus sativus]